MIKTSKKYKKWTTQEDAWLIENYPIIGTEPCAKHFRLPYHGIVNRCRKLKLNRIDPRVWTQEEISLLQKYFPVGGVVECQKYISKSNLSINDKARRLNLINPIFWTEEQENILKLHYFERGSKFCADIVGKPPCSIIDKAGKMGLKNKRSGLKLANGNRICSVCREEKPLEDFSKSESGTRADCKICDAIRSRTYQNKNRESTRARHRRWYRDNPEKVKRQRKLYRPRGRQLQRDKYHSDPKYRQRILESARIYRSNPAHKQIIRDTKKRLTKEYHKNPQWRALQSLRRRMLFVLAGKRKAAHSIELIGCDREHLRAHLERQFAEGMTWDNYGKKGWHIDHIKPCSSFDFGDPAQQKECFHYSNLQPLWAQDNLAKGDIY